MKSVKSRYQRKNLDSIQYLPILVKEAGFHQLNQPDINKNNFKRCYKKCQSIIHKLHKVDKKVQEVKFFSKILNQECYQPLESLIKANNSLKKPNNKIYKNTLKNMLRSKHI